MLDKETDSELNYFYKGITLLEAALGNFEPDETQKSSCDDCQIITRWGSYDGEVMATRFAVMEYAVSIAPEAFAELCRSLDLGRFYQEHISAILKPEDASERAVVDTTLSSNQKHMLAVSAQAAYMQYLTPGADGVKSGISADAYQMLLQVVGNKSGITLDGRAVCYAGLKMLNVDLSGILLIGPDRQDSNRIERLVAYIPGDPAQPLKEYASSADFEVDLKARLHTSAYRRFFSRFVPQRSQGDFFRSLGRQLDPSETYSQAEDYIPIPNQRRVRLSTGETSVQGDLWEYLRQERVNKIINDARAVAVPTGDEDKLARLKKMESYISAVESVFNLAAFVVPGLGEIMLVVGAAQMMSEAFEGIEAFEQGEYKEMWEHFSSVALNVAFITTGAKVIPAINTSGGVDALKPVKMPDGKRLLWKPDLKPYEQKITLPKSTPNELGLHRYDGQDILQLDDKHYVVQKDPKTGNHQIKHPSRPEAYSPELKHNGLGAWTHEAENPRTWEGPRLMRRLGHSVSEFSDTELEQIRRVSGTDEGVLRRMYVESEPPAPLLADTISRFDSYKQCEGFIADMKSDSSSVSAKDHSIDQLHVMTRYGKWPDTVSIRVIDAQAKTVWEYVNPKGEQDKKRVVQIHDTQLRDGRLLKTLLEALDQSETNILLGQRSGTPLGTLNERVETLRGKIASLAESHKAERFNDHYASKSGSSDPRVNLIQERYSSVPTSVIEGLLTDASSIERQQMAKWDFADKQQTKPIPLRLAQELRWAQREVRLSRAYEGLYLDALTTSDTENLVLNTLEKLPGWSSDLRVEVRDGSFSGKLRASVGPESASRKVLVRNKGGRYEARDEDDGHLHGADDLYAALQHALPDTHRTALGLPHVGQGPELKALVGQHVLLRDELRAVLKMQPVKPFFKAPMRWGDGRLGYPLSGRGVGVSQEQQRVLRLFPGFEPDEVTQFLESLGSNRELYLHNFEVELQSLRTELDAWVAKPISRKLPDGGVEAVDTYSKQIVRQKLLNCWQRTDAGSTRSQRFPHGQELNLSGRHIAELPDLSRATFSRISTLDLGDMRLDAVPGGFLSAFPRLLELNMKSNSLQHLPTALGELSKLRSLNLSRNAISMSLEDAATLEKCAQLDDLNLSDNPLTRVPDFSHMPKLERLDLQRTGLTSWPPGLRELPNLRRVDLRNNRIERVPDEILEPTEEHWAAAKRVFNITSLEGNPITAEGLEDIAGAWIRFNLREPVVQGPMAPAAAAAPIESSSVRLGRWLREIPANEQAARTERWNLLDRELIERETAARDMGRIASESEEFFKLLERLSQTADYKKSYTDLNARVWKVLDAAAQSEEMRTRLFALAGDVDTCADGASLIFSRLEISTLADAGLEVASDIEAAPQLLKLAKGLFRLDEVEKIAQRDADNRFKVIAQSNQTLKQKIEAATLIDRVEIRLAYRLGLKDKLELPGQPKQALYTAVAEVTQERLDAAEREIRALDDSPQEFTSTTKRDFWAAFLKCKYAGRFEAAFEPIFTKMEALEEAKGTMTSEVFKVKNEELRKEYLTTEEGFIKALTHDEMHLAQS